jgi:hypothetical protein
MVLAAPGGASAQKTFCILKDPTSCGGNMRQYAPLPTSAVSLLTPGASTRPVLADLDLDGLTDLMVGKGDGTIAYYHNDGSSESANMQLRSGAGDPFSHIDVSTASTTSPRLAFANITDTHGYDLTVGVTEQLLFYKNVGVDAATPEFEIVTGVMNPLTSLQTTPNIAETWRAGCVLSPAYADLNGDTIPDLIIGGCDERFVHFLGRALPASGELQYMYGASPVNLGSPDLWRPAVSIFNDPFEAFSSDIWSPLDTAKSLTYDWQGGAAQPDQRLEVSGDAETGAQRDLLTTAQAFESKKGFTITMRVTKDTLCTDHFVTVIAPL